MKTLSIDIESYAGTDLPKCGVYKYSESKDFDILLFGYAIDGATVQVVDLASGEHHTRRKSFRALTDDAVIKWAFNAQFERICLSRWLVKEKNCAGSSQIWEPVLKPGILALHDGLVSLSGLTPFSGGNRGGTGVGKAKAQRR